MTTGGAGRSAPWTAGRAIVERWLTTEVCSTAECGTGTHELEQRALLARLIDETLDAERARRELVERERDEAVAENKIWPIRCRKREQKIEQELMPLQEAVKLRQEILDDIEDLLNLYHVPTTNEGSEVRVSTWRRLELMHKRDQATAAALADALRKTVAACETLMDEVVGKRATNWGIVNDALVEARAALARLEHSTP